MARWFFPAILISGAFGVVMTFLCFSVSPEGYSYPALCILHQNIIRPAHLIFFGVLGFSGLAAWAVSLFISFVSYAFLGLIISFVLLSFRKFLGARRF